MNLKITIYGDDDTQIEVTGQYTPSCKGFRDKFGVALEPDFDDSITILNAIDQDGISRNLSSREVSRAMDDLWDAIASNYDNGIA